MILRRLGNKSKLAAKIIPYFPAHKIYIEPFFGAGGMFFNKPKAKYNRTRAKCYHYRGASKSQKQANRNTCY